MKKLEELGEEYLTSAENLKSIINRKRQELKVAKRKGDLQKIYFLQRDIKTLNNMKHDCLVTGQYLKNYYKEGRKHYVSNRGLLEPGTLGEG